MITGSNRRAVFGFVENRGGGVAERAGIAERAGRNIDRFARRARNFFRR